MFVFLLLDAVDFDAHAAIGWLGYPARGEGDTSNHPIVMPHPGIGQPIDECFGSRADVVRIGEPTPTVPYDGQGGSRDWLPVRNLAHLHPSERLRHIAVVSRSLAPHTPVRS